MVKFTFAKEVRIILGDQPSVREFIKSNYAQLRASNPSISFLIRQGPADTQSRLTVRYALGNEKRYPLDHLANKEEIKTYFTKISKIEE